VHALDRAAVEATEALRRMHRELWNPDARLVRMARGTAPGVDLAPFDLHPTRDSALGAYLDLVDGEVARAEAAVLEVLSHQYAATGRPWDGTFRTTAEQADPPGDEAVEWFHYDPNWRQFLGCTLALILEDHGHLLGDDTKRRMVAAIVAAAEGEPPDRIPRWYTNPNLMAAWLSAWAGRRTGRDDLVERGVARARRVAERLATYGDVDEYNSPTYDGVDLFAAALWVAFPPAEGFSRWGESFIGAIGSRLGALYHPGLGAVAGPHIRAYGLGLDRYVSMVGLWLALAGEPVGTVLPSRLDQDTVHVHDLYFLPVLARLRAHVLPALSPETSFPRRHEQRFRTTTAVSLLAATSALGAETGRVPRFSQDQYVPVTAHARGTDGDTAWVGARLGTSATAIDGVVVDETTIEATARGDGSGRCEVILTWSAAPVVAGRVARLGPLTVAFGSDPVAVTVEATPDGDILTVAFDRAVAGFRVSVAP
jgi:hypothetical protein